VSAWGGAVGGVRRAECLVSDTSRRASSRPGCGRVRGAGEGAAKTEVTMPGQLALVIDSEAVVPPAVWESLPPERQLQVALRLARLLARLVEAARDE
jgi:hypothetical protein